jgi:beta-lactam-binding protein with PASTA domain
MIKNYLWIIPFFGFLLGYYLTRSLFTIAHCKVPSLIGKRADEALVILSHTNVSLRLLRCKPDSELPPGTIIDQLPTPGQFVKERQAIFVTLSELPSYPDTPSFIGLSVVQAEQLAKQQGIKIKLHELPSVYPAQSCIGQIPAPGQALKEPSLILYVAQPTAPLYIWPDFTNLMLTQALEKIEQLNITPEIIESKHPSSMVKSQRPKSGSFTTLSSNLALQLYI